MPTLPPLLLVVLLTALLHLTHAGNILITPPFPPTAFLGQSYTIRFQGTGLVKPSFVFSQLPPFLKGFPNGTVTGTPTETGSFKVIINYSDKSHNGTAEVIISVGDNNTDHVTLSPNSQGTSSPLFLSFSDGSRTFLAGEAIDIGFQCINAVEPIAVGYNSLPDGLTADQSAIQGSIQAPGLYSFSVVVGDAAGYRTQSFITLNIQPKDANISSNLVDVPVKNEDFNVDSMALQASQANAQNAAKRALQKAISAKNNVTMVQNSVYNSANNLVLAQQASLSYQQGYTDALQNLNNLQTFINNGENAIKANTLRVSLANSSLSQANATLLSSQTAYTAVQTAFQDYSQSFNLSVSSMALASQATSDANTQYNQLSAVATAARSSFTSATNNLEVMKQNKDIAQAMLDNANQVTPIAQLNLQLATQENDAATANFNTALSNVEISKNNTRSIDTYIQEGRKTLQQAKHALGVATFNLQQAKNNLFVAQAAKEAADKAIAIIVAQGFAQVVVQSSKNLSYSSSATSLSTPSFSFRGCDNYAYPSMFGTETILELLPNGARTSGGHKVTWGQCTKKSGVRIGDQIYYEGNLIQSTISLWLLVNLSS